MCEIPWGRPLPPVSANPLRLTYQVLTLGFANAFRLHPSLRFFQS